MTHQDDFNAACIQFEFGTRLDIENYPDVPAFPAYMHTREVALELINSASEHFPNLPQIHFDFINASEVNAVAFKHNEQYFIGITAGAISMLHLVLDRILANPKTFPNIGNPTAERDDLPQVPWSILDPERLFKMGVRPILPQDSKRVMYSKHLADQALMFLLGHEIAHISRGHVDYLDSKTGSPFVAELGWKGKGEAEIERQAIEVDADRRSVYARTNSMFMTANANKTIAPAWQDAPASIESFQYDWAFAVNVLFRLFGDKRFSGFNLDLNPYPPLPLRRRMAMDYASHVLLKNWGEDHKDKIVNAIGGSVKATEFSFLTIGADPPDGGLADAFSDDANAHVQKIKICWDDMKKKTNVLFP
jgi:hypothetical protein